MTIKEIRETSEVVFGKLTFYQDGREIKAGVEFKILDKDTRITHWAGTYILDKYTADEFLDGHDIEVAEEIKDHYIRILIDDYEFIRS